MASVKETVSDYSFHVVGMKQALKLLEERLLTAETVPTLEAQDNVMKEIQMIQMHNEMLELITLRKIGRCKEKQAS